MFRVGFIWFIHSIFKVHLNVYSKAWDSRKILENSQTLEKQPFPRANEVSSKVNMHQIWTGSDRSEQSFRRPIFIDISVFSNQFISNRSSCKWTTNQRAGKYNFTQYVSQKLCRLSALYKISHSNIFQWISTRHV